MSEHRLKLLVCALHMVFGSVAWADGTAQDTLPERQVEDVTVTATAKPQSPAARYEYVVNAKSLQHSASGNGDIGSALRHLPNVQFDRAQNSSKTPGEIAPAEISISGGQPYQNLFLLDGMSMNNDLNPAILNSNQWGGLPEGRSQGLAIDTSLLDKITVMDSNVSAAYGGFGGGVVEAQTKRPAKPFGFQYSYQMTNGNIDRSFPHSLTRYHLHGDPKDVEKFRQSYDKNMQPEFRKYITRMSMESQINDEWGVIGAWTRTRSTIPLRRSEDSYLGTSGNSQGTPIDPENSGSVKQNQKRGSDQYFLKAYFDPTPDLGFSLGYTYAPDYGREYMVGTVDDYYDDTHGGHTVNFETQWSNPWGKLTNTLGYAYLTDERKTYGYDAVKYWQASENKIWSNWATWVREGGHAPSQANQTTLSNKLTQEFKPFHWGGVEHRLLTGFEWARTRADFQYTRDMPMAIKSSTFMTQEQRERCLKTDGQWCDIAPAYDPRKFEKIDGVNVIAYPWVLPSGTTRNIPYWQYGQYFKSISLYQGGKKISVSNDQLSLFLEDDMRMTLGGYGTLSLRPGIRFDYDSYTGNRNWAPRFMADYGFSWNDTRPEYATHLTAGYNRYYARNMYAYALNDGIQSLSSNLYRSDPSIDWKDVPTRTCEPRQSEKINGKSVYYHYKNGVRIEGADTDCRTTSEENSRLTALKVPYSDEFMFGFSQQMGMFHLMGKYIRRNGRDEVVRARRDYAGLDGKKGYVENYFIYTNAGKSKTDVLIFELSNRQPWAFKGINSTFSLAFDWTNVKRNKANYTTNMTTTELRDDFVLWNNELVRYSERPADNFVRPYSLKLNTRHEWDMLGGTWALNNLFSFRQGYQATVSNNKWKKTGADFGIKQDEVTVYKTQKLPSSFTWDVRLGAEYTVHQNNKLFFNIDVFNVLNKSNVGSAVLSATDGSTTPTYEIGRSVWLELGYRF
ncbi:MAG: TonB-dependent receptor plug domain-containing protein [Neisseria sp.]|nr:TonB-dependent receptor plug domain-containing protein [Neisseria sp.]